ncbi:hypothetical protein SteCoe_34374 [Stentor coeruleus]|uniref:Tr-type G domain-containing protein n=1 Tax=Stentor coeruleus TaxID=5963 RepID=A0A1R2AUN8_9CILI|nr:hypothetical protein SteCoe_34374 [Stentor coeruleus]
MSKSKIHIKAAIIGNNDTGKSTLIGQLMLKTGGIDKKTWDQITKEANLISECICCDTIYRYAWILDTLHTERYRNMSINISIRKLQTENFYYTIIDTPGNKQFINKSIRGISQADIVVLIVSSAQGEFESSMSSWGHTKDHAFISFSLGIRQIVVCVSKMDHQTCDWSENRYNTIKNILSEYLQSIGFTSENIQFVPVSGIYGDNLLNPSLRLPWYNGPTFIETLNKITPPIKHYENKPLRLPILQTYNINRIGVVSIGCIQTGILKPGMMVTLAPLGIKKRIKSIEMHNENLEVAFPGDFIGLNIDYCKIKSGMILCDPECDPIQECTSFIAEITVLNCLNRFCVGYSPLVFCHTARSSCRFSDLLMRINKKTGIVSEFKPSFLTNGDRAIVELVPVRPMCVETFIENQNLGRIVIKDFNKIVAVGIIREVKVKEILIGEDRKCEIKGEES